MVGSALHRYLKSEGYKNIIVRTHKELPLDSESQTYDFFDNEMPEYVFLAAAKVGGITANINYPAEFISENLKIQLNVVQAANKVNVKKLLFLGSSCIYPKFAPQPIKEEYLLTGALEESNTPYAIAKIAGIQLCNSYSRQFGLNSFTVMPSNIYGIGDNFHPENSHLVAGMMFRFHNAKIKRDKFVSVWGTGKPLRELTNADDLAKACVYLMKNYEQGGIINVGSSDEISVADLAIKIKNIVGYSGDIVFDKKKPDGTPRKLMDNTRRLKVGWDDFISIDEGLRDMYEWFQKQYLKS